MYFQVKDYKHLRLEDLTSKPESSEEDEHSDGGYSDYINDGLSDEGWSEDGTNRSKFLCTINISAVSVVTSFSL